MENTVNLKVFVLIWKWHRRSRSLGIGFDLGDLFLGDNDIRRSKSWRFNEGQVVVTVIAKNTHTAAVSLVMHKR